MQRFVDDAALGSYVAEQLAAILREKPDALLCIAAGTSSFPVFDALNARVRSGALSLSRASFMGMDEWCGLSQDADGAMADFLRRHFLREAGFGGDVFLFDGLADPETECLRAERFLAAHGGSDAIVFGIGVNGHVALNEPGVDPTLRSHVAAVSPVTATVAQKYFQKEAPALKTGVTIGLANAAEARRIFLLANSAAKRTAIAQIEQCLAAGTVSRQIPASIVAAMPQTEFLVTEAVFA